MHAYEFTCFCVYARLYIFKYLTDFFLLLSPSQDLNPFKKMMPQIRIDLDSDNNTFFWKTPSSETSL